MLPTALPLPRRLLPVLLSAAATLAGCSMGSAQKLSVYQREGFSNTEAYARLFDASAAATCEAARRALLSQGYLISTLRPDSVSASKSFQPEGEVHVQITFHVACLPEGPSGRVATAFVSAIQDRYTLKKSSNSASVGVNAIGSLSIPLGASGDSLVKVGSETIPAGTFYDRFFGLMNRFVSETAADEAAARAGVGDVPGSGGAPRPVPPPSPAASAATR